MKRIHAETEVAVKEETDPRSATISIEAAMSHSRAVRPCRSGETMGTLCLPPKTSVKPTLFLAHYKKNRNHTQIFIYILYIDV